MKRDFLHSTLRELQIIARSPRLWATFSIVVAIFAFTGPYGTGERMAPAIRTAYWLTVHSVTWTIAITFSVISEILLRNRISSMLARMMTGSLAAAAPISPALAVIDFAFTGRRRSLDEIVAAIPAMMPLCALFCLLTYLTMSARPEQGPRMQETDDPEPAPRLSGSDGEEPPIMTRLRPENRGPILHITVEDHYTVVTTSRGRELILMRFADAVKEVGPTPGFKVHRSHWVALAHIERLKRGNGRVLVVLKDGSAVPVSRPNLGAVRAGLGRL